MNKIEKIVAEVDAAGYTIRLCFDDGTSVENTYEATGGGYVPMRMAFDAEAFGENDGPAILAFSDACGEVHRAIL